MRVYGLTLKQLYIPIFNWFSINFMLTKEKIYNYYK